mmetsp:Transcript_44/g.111  ORF Transcript_44/g.111 Transcript_44/m.111 type:complete len:250 (-) Transcript_44:55-804(-)|eukprot:CAMPEP_0184709054 /NCGR_PEP_ID=MMETSP0314-20130426/303_1 /TAXON_ID=38298 /ORGANISM="Rhodella maculata, Strain CCMP 736" /LENGTH=249 /DNA_ID=CAMNT_0027170701 /DNA_START=41 /DNA_END=790 /DNA_ORIENTATION=+
MNYYSTRRTTLSRPQNLGEGLEVGELLNDALAGDKLLEDEAHNSDHSKARVLQLIEFEFLDRAGLPHAEGIEPERARLAVLHIVAPERGQLDQRNHGDDLGPALKRNLPDGSQRPRLREVGPREVHEARDDETEDGEHGDSAILKFALAGVLEVDVVGEVERVEAGVANHGAIEGGGRLEEGDGLRLAGGHGDGGGGAGGDGLGGARGEGRAGEGGDEGEHGWLDGELGARREVGWRYSAIRLNGKAFP